MGAAMVWKLQDPRSILVPEMLPYFFRDQNIRQGRQLFEIVMTVTVLKGSVPISEPLYLSLSSLGYQNDKRNLYKCKEMKA